MSGRAIQHVPQQAVNSRLNIVHPRAIAGYAENSNRHAVWRLNISFRDRLPTRNAYLAWERHVGRRRRQEIEDPLRDDVGVCDLSPTLAT